MIFQKNKIGYSSEEKAYNNKNMKNFYTEKIELRRKT